MLLARQGDCGQTKTVPQKNHGQTMLKMSSISDLKGPTVQKMLDSLNTMMHCAIYSHPVIYKNRKEKKKKEGVTHSRLIQCYGMLNALP